MCGLPIERCGTGKEGLSWRPASEKKVGEFQYLESLVQNNADVEGEVTHRLRTGWAAKWKQANEDLCLLEG